ncbi:MAG: DUF2065 domain-containing protein [Rhodobacteraceae bacterium]|nr:DUF2065 domain-containing protein [Paracoccaceae bacterium]
MTILLLAVGFVLVFEGLVLALAPSRLEDMVRMLAQIPVETRRTIGLSALAAGVVLLWVARHFAGG